MKRGQGYQLMERMAEERNRINADKELYRWPDEFLQADSVFLKQAIDSIKKSGQAGAGGAAIEQKSKQYTEMMKQLEYVQSLTEAGINPSGEEMKAMVTAVKSYNNGGQQSSRRNGYQKGRSFQGIHADFTFLSAKRIGCQGICSRNGTRMRMDTSNNKSIIGIKIQTVGSYPSESRVPPKNREGKSAFYIQSTGMEEESRNIHSDADAMIRKNLKGTASRPLELIWKK